MRHGQRDIIQQVPHLCRVMAGAKIKVGNALQILPTVIGVENELFPQLQVGDDDHGIVWSHNFRTPHSDFRNTIATF